MGIKRVTLLEANKKERRKREKREERNSERKTKPAKGDHKANESLIFYSSCSQR